MHALGRKRAVKPYNVKHIPRDVTHPNGSHTPKSARTGVRKAARAAAVTEADYVEATDMYLGWCPSCGEFTGECVEPDVSLEHAYACLVCSEFVYGAEQALLEGLIEVIE